MRAEAARGLARSAIGAIASGAAPEALYLEPRDSRVAVEVVQALARHTLDARARARVVAALTSSSFFRARRAAALALATPADPATAAAELAALEKALADPYDNGAQRGPPRAREEGPAAALTHARELARDPSAQHRMAAAGALSALAKNADTKAEALSLLEGLAREEQPPRPRPRARRPRRGARAGKGARRRDRRVRDRGRPGRPRHDRRHLDGRRRRTRRPTLAAIYERTRDKPEQSETREDVIAALAKRGARLGPEGRKAIERGLSDPASSVAAAAARAAATLGGAAPAKAPPRARAPLAVLVRDFADKRPVLTIETNRGTFEVELYPDDAPVHVSNVVALAEKKFYDGLTWHRVELNFVVQGGCPKGDGSGGPGYSIPDELSARPYVRGTLGMPKTAQKDTGGCPSSRTGARLTSTGTTPSSAR